jgi:hypothetical protein
VDKKTLKGRGRRVGGRVEKEGERRRERVCQKGSEGRQGRKKLVCFAQDIYTYIQPASRERERANHVSNPCHLRSCLFHDDSSFYSSMTEGEERRGEGGGEV